MPRRKQDKEKVKKFLRVLELRKEDKHVVLPIGMMPYGKVPIPSRDEGIPVDKFNIMKEDLEKHLTEVRKSHNIPRPRRIRMFEDTDDEEIELPRTSIEDTSHVVDEAPVPIVSLQETYGQTDTEKAQLRPPSALHVENPPVMVFDIAQEEGPPIRTSDSDDDFQHITLSMKEAHGGRAATSKSKASTGRKGTRQKTRPTAKGEDARAAASSPKLEARSQGKMVQYDSSDTSIQLDLSHRYQLRSKGKATVSSASTKSRKRIRGGCLQVEERPSIEAEATLKQWSNSDTESTMKSRKVSRRIESSSDESDDGSDKCPGSKNYFRYKGMRYKVPTSVPFRRCRSNDVDVDSLTCAIDLERFIETINLSELATLHSKCGGERSLRHLLLYATVQGYGIFVPASTSKDRVCEFLRRWGPIMHGSSSSSVFFTGTSLCNALVALRALVSAGLEYVAIHAYGMKMTIDFLEPLVPLMIDVPSVPKRLDVGVTTECNGIPLFYSPLGNTYAMLYMAGLGRGSTSTQGDLPDGCRTLTYPTVLHHIKALLKSPKQKPTKYETIIRKGKQIDRLLRDLNRIGTQLHGYRVEMQLRGNFSMPHYLTVARTMTGDLPDDVVATYVIDAKSYIENIRTFYDHCTANNVFRGRKIDHLPANKLKLYYQLLNVIGFWSHLLAYYIRSMPLGKLPTFMSNLIQSCTQDTKFPQVAKTLSISTTSDSQTIDVKSDLYKEVQEKLEVFNHPTNKKRYCARTSRGQVTKSFDSKEKLYQFVIENYKNNWKTSLKLI